MDKMANGSLYRQPQQTPAHREDDTVLATCQRQWQAAFTNSLVGFGFCDLDRRLLIGNQVLERLVGRTVAELHDVSISIATHPDDRERGFAFFRMIATGEQEQGISTKRYIHRDGTVIWCQVLLNLVRNHKNEPHLVLMLLVDITEQMRVTQALQAQTLGLTKTELAVLALLADPNLKTYPQIGERLSRSGETVRKHAQHIASKLGLSTAERTEIVQVAKERGLLDLPLSDKASRGE